MEKFSLINNDIGNLLIDFGKKNQMFEEEVICSIVYEFARKLPYSIDYKDNDFVHGIFLNVAPVNPSKLVFKDYGNLYNIMFKWNDTKKSAILLKVCSIFQAMLMGYISDDYQLKEEDFLKLGIDQITNNEEYNYLLFEALQMLSQYCIKLNSIDNSEERRKLLDEIFMIILDKVGQKIGGFRKTSTEDNVITINEHKATIKLLPHKDLAMLYYFENINLNSNVGDLINNINKKFIKETNLSNENISLESNQKMLKK